MNFDDIYAKLLVEANNIYPIFEYVDDEIITENPDDFYNERGSHSFLLHGDFYAADIGENTMLTHGDMILELESHFINGESPNPDIAFGGKVSKKLKDFFQQTYTNKLRADRDDFLNNLPSAILGRINIPSRIVSFWNAGRDFTPKVITNVLKLISEVYKKKPASYRYEIANDSDYYDSELLKYKDFVSLNGSKGTPAVKVDTSRIVHNLDPAIKGQVMKLQGVKPKKGLGAEARFLMGEDIE